MILPKADLAKQCNLLGLQKRGLGNDKQEHEKLLGNHTTQAECHSFQQVLSISFTLERSPKSLPGSVSFLSLVGLSPPFRGECFNPKQTVPQHRDISWRLYPITLLVIKQQKVFLGSSVLSAIRRWHLCKTIVTKCL